MYEFQVEGMTCGGCVNSITSAVRRLDPKAQVVADLQTQKVQVESLRQPSELAAAMEDAGYTVLATVQKS